MALALVTTHERATLVSVADPDVQLPAGARVSPLYLYPSSAPVVADEETRSARGATRMVVRALSDVELAAISGRGEHTLFVGAARRAIVECRPSCDLDQLPYAVKYGVGQWVVANSQGAPLELVRSAEQRPKGEEGTPDADAPLPQS